MKFVILFLALVTCGVLSQLEKPGTLVETPKANENPVPIDLRGKLELYERLIKSVQDDEGFIEAKSCQSTMYSGLLAIKNLEAAEKSGQWYRRSQDYPECFETGQTTSTMTRDQLLGPIYWAIKTKNRPALDRMYNYGYHNNWILGEGEISKTVGSSRLISTIAQSIYYLGGRDIKQRFINQDWPDVDGYNGYIQVLHLLIRGEIYGTLNKSEIKVLERHVKLHPGNPFYQIVYQKYTDRNFDKAVSMLMNKYPANRLPKSENYCSAWPIEKDFNTCPEEGKTHSGGDFIFMARIILETK